MDESMLTPADLSRLLGGVPVETLQAWRSRGTGPAFVKVGRHVRYRRAAVDVWLRERERQVAERGGGRG